MPEGPEVRRAADQIERIAGGTAITLDPCPWPEHADALARAGLERVETWGKAAVLRFADGRGIYVHLQLYGRWRFGRSEPRTRRALRLGLHGPRSSARLYSATDLALLEPGEVHPFVAALGPDPLHPGTRAAAIAAALSRTPRRALGSALLDQQQIAGLGNYLRAEILWEAEVAPRRGWASLTPAEHEGLITAILAIPRRSLQGKGVTVLPRWAGPLEAAGLPPRLRRHAVYGRAGHPCLRCGATITRELVGGRALFACPACQR